MRSKLRRLIQVTYISCLNKSVILQRGADIGQSDMKGDNALILASIHTSDSNITKQLLEAEQKVDINKRQVGEDKFLYLVCHDCFIDPFTF